MMFYIITVILLIIIIVFLFRQINLQKSYYDYKSRKLTAAETTYKKEVTKLTDSVSTLEQAAYYHSITNIGNMEYFVLHKDRFFQSYPDSSFTLIVFGVANIAKINKLYGPLEGDHVLVYIADCLKKIEKEHALYAHLQSNLFGILLKDKSENAIVGFIHELTTLCTQYSTLFSVITQFGILPITDIHMSAADMFNCSSLAQKSVKNPQEKNFAYFTESLNETYQKNKEMCDEMEQALDAHKFIMYLQPMINLHQYHITCAECLVRWEHPEKGLLSPYAFLPVFENTNLIFKLDYYMWEEGCKTLRHWIDNNIEAIPITLNISPIHLNDDRFVDILIKLVDRYKLQRKLIILELPERALINSKKDLFDIISLLAEAGFPLCIDNFGSMHSPVNLLKDLPVTFVKLDRKFLTENSSTEKGLTILRYVVAMAKELDLSVITEGVETLEQANFLVEIGCDIAQGYFFSKPISLRDFDKLSKKMTFGGYQPNEYYPTFSDMELSVDIMEKMLHS